MSFSGSSPCQFYGWAYFFLGNAVIGSLSSELKCGDPAFQSLGSVDIFSSVCVFPAFLYYQYHKSNQNEIDYPRLNQPILVTEEDEEEGVGYQQNTTDDFSYRKAFSGAFLGLISSVAFSALYITAYNRFYDS